MKIDNCTALITGASAGLGQEFARQLGNRARSIVLVARREQKLTDLREELLRQNPKLEVHVRVVDLADRSQIDVLADSLEREKIDIDFLINNAGLGDLGPFATGDLTRLDQMIQVNMTALTLLTRRLLPPMIARGRGAILNVSSSAGFLPIPSFSVYAASKAYVTSFSEALRIELRDSGVSVCAVCPGPVHTEFSEVAQRPGQPPDPGPEFVYVPAEEVVREGLAGIEYDKPLIIPGLLMKLGMFFVRITPMSILRLAARLSPRRAPDTRIISRT